MEENSKLKNSIPKVKEKRVSNPQSDNPPKRNLKTTGLPKNDFSHLVAPQNFDVSSSVKKIFNEANKIVKIGMEKEFALHEKNNILQNSNETIDNLRKNILHLQMEYEKLDQNYQREISNRGEIIKRMDDTKKTVESVIQYSSTLASSIKLLEEDKCRIVEYYELIYQGQKEIEAKHTEAAKFINELEFLIKSKIDDLKKSYDKTFSRNSETISELNLKLSYTANKLKVTGEENENLQSKTKELQEIVSKMETSLNKQQNLNSIHQEALYKLKFSIKKLKTQRFKYQKLLKNKKKKIFNLLNSNNIRRKDLENMEALLEKSTLANKVLETKNYEWETKFESHLQEEALRNRNWEAQVKELRDKIKLLEMENEKLRIENKTLSEKVLDLTKEEEGKQKEIEDLQNDLSKMLSSNLTLQEDLKKLNDETTRKKNEISDLEAKITEFGSKSTSEAIFYQNEVGRYQELVKKLENQLSDVEKKLLLEKNQKEILLSDCECKLENLKIADEKINNLEKLLENKEICIKEMKYQQTTLNLDGKKALEKLNKDLQAQSVKNKELSSDFVNLENNYSTVKKELQEAKNKIMDLEEKLNEEKVCNKKLKGTKTELEKNADILKKEMECDKYSFQELQEKYRKAEKELMELRKTVKENAGLKSTVVDLQNNLKATEARIEAYKVVVKKLETEKAEVKATQFDQIHQEEPTKNSAESSKPQMNTSQANIEQMNKKDLESLNSEIRERNPGKEEYYKVDPKSDLKENEPQATDAEKWLQTPSTPVHDSKKFLTTPRKIFTSTPQPGFRNLTPFRKKRDPYEFDSDSSVEKFDPEQVLKVFNRQKKDNNKKSKTNK